MNADLRETAIRVERPAKTLRELALEKVRDAIVDGYFKPGERLVERDLCAQLGVSRTIVREVLRHLESEGLVASLPNKGPIVARLDLEEAKQIYEIRGALEGMAARLCAERRDPAIVEALENGAILIRATEDLAALNLEDYVLAMAWMSPKSKHSMLRPGVWETKLDCVGALNNGVVRGAVRHLVFVYRVDPL